MISSSSLLHQAAYMKTSPLYLYSCIPLLLFVQYSYISLHRALIKVLHTILNTYTLHSYFLTYLMFETHQSRICRLELGKTRFHYWVKAHISLNIGFSRHFESNQEMTHQLKSESMPQRERDRESLTQNLKVNPVGGLEFVQRVRAKTTVVQTLIKERKVSIFGWNLKHDLHSD